MKIYKEKQLTALDHLDCDFCGNRINEMKGYLQLKALWGYGSSKDMTKWEAEYCEDCSDEIKKFINSRGGKVNVKQAHDLLQK